MDSHKHEELRDELLEREIEAALDVDPSPEFLARVRTRISDERAQRWPWPGPWAWASAGLLIVAVATASIWIFRSPLPDAAPQIALAPSPAMPGDPGQRSQEEVGTTGMVDVVPWTIAASAPAARQAQDAELRVLVSPVEADALDYLVSALTTRRIEPSAIPDLDSAPALLPPIEEIVLEPISLSPLVRLESEDGVRQ
jgi:hypothetical protein